MAVIPYNLLRRLDELLSGGSRAVTEIGGVDIPWVAGASDGNGPGNSFVVLQGGVVSLVGEAGFTPSASSRDLFTLPVGLRPLVPEFSDFVAIVEFGICWVDPIVPCRITVASNGLVTAADLPAETLNNPTYVEFTGISFPAATV